MRAIVFDLDGTLIDTAPDFARVVNHLLAQHQRAPVSEQLIRDSVSAGSATMIARAFGEGVDHHALRQQLLDDYQAIIGQHAYAYDGVIALLDALQTRGIATAIVTNKPGELARLLLQRMQLLDRFDHVIGGGDTARSKPDPQPLMKSCERLQLPPAQCHYIGDALRDMQAATAAGMPGWVAGWGYIAANDDVETWPATGILSRPDHVLSQCLSDV